MNRTFYNLLVEIKNNASAHGVRDTRKGHSERLYLRSQKLIARGATESSCRSCVLAIIERVCSWPAPMPDYYDDVRDAGAKALYLRACELLRLDPRTIEGKK